MERIVDGVLDPLAFSALVLVSSSPVFEVSLFLVSSSIFDFASSAVIDDSVGPMP